MVAVIDAVAMVLFSLSAGGGPQPGTARLASWKGACLLHFRGPPQPAVAVPGLAWLLNRMLF